MGPLSHVLKCLKVHNERIVQVGVLLAAHGQDNRFKFLQVVLHITHRFSNSQPVNELEHLQRQSLIGRGVPRNFLCLAAGLN